MAGDLNKPALTDTYANVLAEIRDNFADQAKAFDGTSTANMPVGTKRLIWSTGKFEQYNGSTWDTLALNGMTIGITTPAAAKFTTLTTTGNSALGDAEATATHAIKGATTVLANSADAALKITQTGSGNALVVEDSGNPDATPFVIDADGNVLCANEIRVGSAGTTEAYPSFGNRTPLLQLKSASNALSAVSARYSANSVTGSPSFILAKSRASNTVVLSGDTLGTFSYVGHDGTAFIEAASIQALVDGNPGTNDMPGRLVFSTTVDGGSTPIERMRIDSAGRIGFNGTPSTTAIFLINNDVTGGTSSRLVRGQPIIKSDVTTSASVFLSQASTEATAFTLTDLEHFIVSQGAIGAGSAVTNQYGFRVNTTLVGAVNNYAFHSGILSGTGRWNFYANGTAPNYFAGDVRTNTTVLQAASPSNSNTSVTITIASMIAGLRTGTPVANIDYTLPTGTVTDAAFQDLQTNQSFEWSVINLAAATFTITLLAATGHTVVGNMVVQPNTSARFLTRKSAANTFITYRIA